MQKILLFILLGTNTALFAQPTWSEEVAEVFYNNCTECHNPEGIGTFSMMDYETAYDYRALIQSYVEYDIMPPWTADPTFQHYFGERILTSYERETILEWASGDAAEGDPALAPPPPVYTGDQILPGTPGLVVEMPNYMSKATETADDYICISIPIELSEDRRVKAIEVIPGNRSIVHHCLVYLDPEGTYETDTSGLCGGPTSDAYLMTGYTPGASPSIFPSNDEFSAGMVMPTDGNIVLALHYPHGSYGEYDQTRVNFYFYDEPVDNFREIFAGAFLQNWEFELPANEITEVEAVIDELPYDLTVLSAFPHMHLLGNSIETYGLSPDGDTIPFVRIPHYDFDWQDFYWFEYMQKLPAGSSLIGRGSYDNTLGNPHNPSDPPVDVYPGFNTTDEMFLIYYHAMLYHDGDEDINVDSLNTIYLSQEDYNLENDLSLRVYPNPFQKTIAVAFTLQENANVSLYVYDVHGRIVRKLKKNEALNAGAQEAVWDGKTDQGAEAAKGLYYYSLNINGRNYSGRMIRQ